MIKTKTMLSKAWAICSAFKPEESLNDRLSKTIQVKGTDGACSFGQFGPDRKIQEMSSGRFSTENAGILNLLLADKNQDFITTLAKDTAIGFETEEGGAK